MACRTMRAGFAQIRRASHDLLELRCYAAVDGAVESPPCRSRQVQGTGGSIRHREAGPPFWTTLRFVATGGHSLVAHSSAGDDG